MYPATPLHRCGFFCLALHFSLVLVHLHQPLSRSLNADVPEQLITPLVSLGHISMLAPDQFASPMKSIVANFIVKDLLMNDRVCAGLNAHRHFCGCDWRFKIKTFLIFIILQSAGDKNGKLWTTDEEVSPEVLAKVRGKGHSGVCYYSDLSCLLFMCFYNQQHSCLW